MVSEMDYVYIIVNIFVNTQSILKIIASKRNVSMVYVYLENIATQFKSWRSMKVRPCATAISTR